jgi:hypothetical protein
VLRLARTLLMSTSSEGDETESDDEPTEQ